MICIADYRDERRELQKLLDDVAAGRTMYEGTTCADLAEIQYNVFNADLDEISEEDAKHYIESFYDYCLGKIIEYDGNLEEQLRYFDVISKLKKESERLRGLVMKIIEKEKKK